MYQILNLKFLFRRPAAHDNHCHFCRLFSCIAANLDGFAGSYYQYSIYYHNPWWASTYCGVILDVLCKCVACFTFHRTSALHWHLAVGFIIQLEQPCDQKAATHIFIDIERFYGRECCCCPSPHMGGHYGRRHQSFYVLDAHSCHFFLSSPTLFEPWMRCHNIMAGWAGWQPYMHASTIKVYWLLKWHSGPKPQSRYDALCMCVCAVRVC